LKSIVTEGAGELNATGWLGWEDSNSETSSQNIPLKGRTDFRGSSRTLAKETIRVWTAAWEKGTEQVASV